MAKSDKIAVENVNVPGQTRNLDRAKYETVRRVLLEVLPSEAPGLTQREMTQRVRERLPESVFPGGEKAGWWAKAVQLDLEAKGLVIRDTSAKPLRWQRAGS